MKKIISVILLLIAFFPAHGCSEESLKALSYSISFKEVSNNKLLVECTFQGDETGLCELVLPHSWANQLELDQNIEELSCIGHTLENSDQPHIKIIHHSANEWITIHYSVRLLSDNLSRDNYYRPVGNHTYFYAIGHGLFIIPTRANAKMAITLQWNDIPEEWKVATSFGQQQVRQEMVSSPYELRSAAYLAGDFQIIPCNSNMNPIYVAIRGKWPFSADEFTALVEQIFISQRDFWNDHDFPYYLISLIPVHSKNSTGGTALRDTFSLFLGDNSFSKEEYLKHLAQLISHEHFHTWNGHKIRSSEPEGSMYWFSEGFTEYYAMKLNHNSGIISKEESIDHINEMLTDYFSSPIHNASNETIVKNFWTDPATNRLPYARGFALALYLDTKIQSQSNGLSLDNLMHDLLKFTTQAHSLFSFDDLSILMENYVDQEELLTIKKCIVEGESVPILQHALGSDYSLQWEDYVGFNLKKSLTNGIVQGVKYGSLPFQAGLKNGLTLAEYNRNGTTMTLTVIDHQEKVEKKIFYDLNEIKQIPQYIYH